MTKVDKLQALKLLRDKLASKKGSKSIEQAKPKQMLMAQMLKKGK